MKAVYIDVDDLQGFLDADDREPTANDMRLINSFYAIYCANANADEKKDYIENYNGEGYYPPFVAECVSNVFSS